MTHGLPRQDIENAFTKKFSKWKSGIIILGCLLLWGSPILSPWLDILIPVYSSVISSTFLQLGGLLLVIASFTKDPSENVPTSQTDEKLDEKSVGSVKDSTKSIKELKKQLEEIDDLLKEKYGNEKINAWKTETKICLIDAFGEDSLYVQTFDGIYYSLTLFSSGTSEYRFQEAYTDGLREAKELLKRCISKLERDLNP